MEGEHGERSWIGSVAERPTDDSRHGRTGGGRPSSGTSRAHPGIPEGRAPPRPSHNRNQTEFDLFRPCGPQEGWSCAPALRRNRSRGSRIPRGEAALGVRHFACRLHPRPAPAGPPKPSDDWRDSPCRTCSFTASGSLMTDVHPPSFSAAPQDHTSSRNAGARASVHGIQPLRPR